MVKDIGRNTFFDFSWVTLIYIYTYIDMFLESGALNVLLKLYSGFFGSVLLNWDCLWGRPCRRWASGLPPHGSWPARTPCASVTKIIRKKSHAGDRGPCPR